MRFPTFSRQTWLLTVLIAVKLAIHFFAHSFYGLHRDEYLYVAEGEHLGWGYMEGPPMIAWLARIAILLGKTEFTVRLIPALAGSVVLFLMVRLVGHLKGSFAAQVLVGLCLLFSPALLGSNNLFQPVTFNQLGWVALAYALVRLVQTENPRYWCLLGAVAGLGLLTKYSLAFWALALGASILLSPHRRWLRTYHPYAAIGIAIAMFLPNLAWQVRHHWPLLEHMRVLRETQLVNVEPGSFVAIQLMYQGFFVLVWVAGLLGPWLVASLKPYRWISLAYLFTLGLLLYLSGKPYYLMGAYPILFVLGALTWDRWLRQSWRTVAFGAVLATLTLPLLPLAVPLLPLDTMVNYSAYLQNRVGLYEPFRWEDGVVRNLRQDYADMHGWEEMVESVAEFYHDLPSEQQTATQIYGGGYGHVGALNFYREKYALPEAVSFNASFVMWVPEEFPYTQQIQVDDQWRTQSDVWASFQFIDSTEHPYARDPGYIYFVQNATQPLDSTWAALVAGEKAPWSF